MPPSSRQLLHHHGADARMRPSKAQVRGHERSAAVGRRQDDWRQQGRVRLSVARPTSVPTVPPRARRQPPSPAARISSAAARALRPGGSSAGHGRRMHASGGAAGSGGSDRRSALGSRIARGPDTGVRRNSPRQGYRYAEIGSGRAPTTKASEPPAEAPMVDDAREVARVTGEDGISAVRRSPATGTVVTGLPASEDIRDRAQPDPSRWPRAVMAARGRRA